MPEAMKRWHLDPKIPIGLIFALLVQTAGLVWWASNLSASVNEHSRKFVAIEATEAQRSRDERALYARLGLLDGTLSSLQSTLTRVEAKLDRDRP